MDQRRLVERASNGDRAAYAELVLADVGRLDTVARLVLRDPELARDVVQEALTRAWRDLPGMRDFDRFDLRLYRLTVDGCFDRARRRRRHQSEADLMPHGWSVTASPIIAPADRAMVDALLRRLTERDRAIVCLHAFVGLPIPETADLVGLSVEAATSRFDRAMDELQLGAYGDGDGRLDRSMPGILEDLGAGQSPEDVEDVLAAVARTRQRPSWAVPGRWLPPAAISRTRRSARRLPWRGIIVVAASIGLLASGVVVVASPFRRSPPSTGAAGNGLIAYSDGGDIFVGDPVTGKMTAVVVGPESDMQPVFSPDGSRIAFVRKYELETIAAGGDWQEEPYPLENTDIISVRPDGTDPRIITPDRRSALQILGWTADSAYVLAEPLATFVYGRPSALALDASGAPPPLPISNVIPRELYAAWPSTGDHVLNVDQDGAIVVFAARGEGATVLVDRSDLETALERDTVRDGRGVPEPWAPVWSPDRSMVAFIAGVAYGGDCGDREPPFFLYGALFDSDVECVESWAMIVNADGSGLRRAAPASDVNAPGIYVSDDDVAWSPDSARVLFDRRLWIETGTPYDGPTCCSVVIADVASGASREVDVSATGYEGDAGADDRWWSPDGRSVLLYDYRRSKLVTIDAATGKVTPLPWRVGVGPSWQRVAGP